MDKAAFSYQTFKEDIKNWVIKNFKPDSTILDVGAGSGTYSKLLGKFFPNIDAVEIYRPNITDYNLFSLYRFVSNRSIVGLEYPFYDLIIFGDVIEHLSVEDAQKVLEYASERCHNLIVAVPYSYKQDGNENEHEHHIQSDLTQENVLERYPMLKPLFIDKRYGYYIKKQ